MSPMEENPKPASSWKGLGETLAGSFAARARGLLASDFALLGGGDREIGRLRVGGPEGAQLQAGEIEARIERTAPGCYEMLAGGARVLAAEPAGSPDKLAVRCAGHVYEARLSLLRNAAEARRAGGRAARLTGGLTNRRYEAVFDAEDEGSLPVAIFLLYRTVALRRGAYRAGARGG